VILACSAQLLTKDALGAAHAKDRAKGLSAAQLERLTDFHIRCEPALTEMTPNLKPCE